MRLSSFVLVLILFSSLALATTVTVDKQNYATTGVVKVSGTCNAASVSVGLQAGIGLNTIWVEQVTAGVNNKFSADFYPSQTGSYTVYASCKGENSDVESFCIGSDCATVDETPKDTPGSSSSGSSSGGGGGGGGGCSSNWNCTQWSACNSSSKQSRNCVDLKKCKQNITEVQNCTWCVESWVCSQWSECKWNIHERNCKDEHNCGTIKLRPILQKPCEQVAAPVQEAQTYIPSSPPPQGIIAKLKQAVVGESFWNNYKFYIIGLIAFVVLMIIVVILFLVLHKPKKVYNLDELKEWVVKERQTGTSDADIKTILVQNTGWKEDEIFQVLGGQKAIGRA